MRMLERDDIATLADAALRKFIEAPPDDAQFYSILVTSGTTGRGPIAAFSNISESIRSRSKLFWEMDPVVICTGTIGMRFFYSIQVMHAPEARRVIALDNTDLEKDIAPLFSDMPPRRVIGFPSFIVRFGAKLTPQTAAAVRSVACVGESLSPELHRALTRTFPNARISSFYATVEVKALSKETCGNMPLNHYHPLDGVRFEIFEPDSEGIGDVLISKQAFGTYIERYRIGDIGRLHEKPCACGETTTIELLGRRGHDYLKLAGALLIRNEFDRVMHMFPYISDYRAEASLTDAMKGKLLLRVLAPSGASEALRKEFAARFSEELFLTPTETLERLVARGLFEPLTVEWVDAFEDGHKPVKLRRV